MRTSVLTTNQRDCCPSRRHNINSNFTHFLLKTFVLSFVSQAKPTTTLFIDSPGRTAGQKPGFLPKDALQTAEQGKKPGNEGFDASRTN